MPLGLNGLLCPPRPEDFPVLTEQLQPADRLLLVTDGVDEARNATGEFFGRTRLAEFAAREAASGVPTPELMRRLQQAILRHQTGRLQDDATTLFVEWLPGREEPLSL
jgi:serine phosphatase RsbU (regulator of sigma subunit)